jgi:hypothetical protein
VDLGLGLASFLKTNRQSSPFFHIFRSKSTPPNQFFHRTVVTSDHHKLLKMSRKNFKLVSDADIAKHQRPGKIISKWQ